MIAFVRNCLAVVQISHSENRKYNKSSFHISFLNCRSENDSGVESLRQQCSPYNVAKLDLNLPGTEKSYYVLSGSGPSQRRFKQVGTTSFHSITS